jgi:hypothetical protein
MTHQTPTFRPGCSRITTTTGGKSTSVVCSADCTWNSSHSMAATALLSAHAAYHYDVGSRRTRAGGVGGVVTGLFPRRVYRFLCGRARLLSNLISTRASGSAGASPSHAVCIEWMLSWTRRQRASGELAPIAHRFAVPVLVVVSRANRLLTGTDQLTVDFQAGAVAFRKKICDEAAAA